IYDNAAGAVVKYEALMRMIDDGKVVTPFYFLEIAKQTKLYTSLTKRLMTKVFESLKGKTYEVSINITFEDICSLEIKEHLSALLQEYPIGSQIIFEIVESEGIQNFDEVIKFIAIIRTHGCRIAIDDFGTGYSNFTYLMKLEPDFIKIDGSLIKALLDEQSSRNVVVAIVDFAKKMGIKTVAEFVENEVLQTEVTALGIDFSQGYFHGKPTETL
ncbi:MAG: EAL domain-containing protein, partial [Sulfurospirillum sp.]|nr:EAL domain-containing protein [Sulfurospirillum sp.]